MGWVNGLKGAVVGLDTTPLIYYIETNQTFVAYLDEFFEALDRAEFTVVTSYITLLEVLVHPIRRGDTALADQYRSILLESSGLVSLPLSIAIVEEAARLRALYNVRTPDALQMATAVNAGASVFLTNDMGLPQLPNMKVLVLDTLVSKPPSAGQPST